MADFTRFDTSRRLAIGLLMAMAILLSGCNVDTCEIKPYAQCPNADLGDANLYGADLTSADLHGADLRGADLRLARFFANTQWPEGFDPVAAGAVLVDD